MRIHCPLQTCRHVQRLVWLSVIATTLAVMSPTVHATQDLVERARDGAFSAQGLYEPRITRYDNGLTLITKQRTGARTVSVRVSVGVGMAHYECGQQHVPHFLEHMLFGAVPGMSEAELERRFFELGASSNARTEDLRTVYKLDVFSGTALDALGLLAEMLTNAELQESSFRDTKKIIRREMGGDPGPVELQSLPGGPLASGWMNLAADLSPRHFNACGEWDAGQEVEFASVRGAYDRFYEPQEMTWIVVGDFDEAELHAWADERLGDLARGSSAAPEDPVIADFARAEYGGLDWEPGITLLALTTGYQGDDHYARAFLSHLLDETLYKRLRLDAALTYTPNSLNWNWEDWGLFAITAESEKADHDEALRIIREIVDRLVSAPLGEEEFRTVQLSLLRQWAQSPETNAGYAGYYVGSLFELRRNGSFINDELAIARLTPERVHRVAQRMFAPQNTVIVRDGDRQARIDARRDAGD